MNVIHLQSTQYNGIYAFQMKCVNFQIRNLLLKSFIIRLTDETIHSRIQSGMKKEKKLFEMLLSDNERKFHELESKHRYLIEDKDTLQSR